MNTKQSQSGRSMVEMLGVISIIGLITVAGITSMGYVDTHFRSSATVIEIDNIAKDIIDSFSWSSGYEDLTPGFLISEGILKNVKTKTVNEGTESEKTATVAENRWGGEITAEPTADKVSFIITYTNVPEIPCRQIVNASQSNEMYYVKVTSHKTEDSCKSTNELTFSPRDYEPTSSD